MSVNGGKQKAKKKRVGSMTAPIVVVDKLKKKKAARSGSVTGTASTKMKNEKKDPKKKKKIVDGGDVNVGSYTTTKITDSDGIEHTIKLDELLTGLGAVGEKLFSFDGDVEVEVAKQQTDAGSIVFKALFTKAQLLRLTKEKQVSDALIKPFEVLFNKSAYSDYVQHRNAVLTKTVFNLIWELTEQLSNLAIYPYIIAKMPELATIKDRAKKEFLNESNLLFTFALRNILARVAFQTVLSKAVFDALRDHIESPDSSYEWKGGVKWFPWKEAIAFVGFNRLLSPKNSIGVSISSDIDFKLVFDPSVVFQKGTNKEITPLQTKEFVQLLNNALKKCVPAFDEARLTLEVEDFTTKDLSSVADVLQKFEAERNFYASMVNNNVFIAGSELVYAKFLSSVRDYIKVPSNNFIVAKRTFSQYLGESDKGSILAIAHVKKLKAVVDACGETLRKYLDSWSGQGALKTFCKLTHHTEHEWHSLTDRKKEGWVTSVRVFYKLVNGAKMKLSHLPDGEVELVKLIVEERSVSEALLTLEAANVFPSLRNNHIELLKRVSKLLKGLADDEILSFEGRHLIGYHPYEPNFSSATYKLCGSKLSTDTSWRFNIKYVGCRLSDFFDAVPLKDYKKWNGTSAEAVYGIAKRVAVAINKFALSMQTAIYLAAIYRLQPDDADAPTVIAASHSTIDNLYSRVSNSEFTEIIVMSAKDPVRGVGGLVDIRASLTALATDLSSLKNDCNKTMKKSSEEVTSHAETLKTAIDDLGTKTPSNDGKKLFDAIFKLASDTANSLIPKPV
eukprot:CAMPEP_0119015008 /NCGR_PEP_ID=MMETSP1176-20130426/10506_1 /TAXON_ID=265551 /ORGANISM="Synedropsis recta cf, Strain CCMP1620" /LENGTH=787 /DNA_ID=CAMNT_0006968267 /DNA_START=75 /DNA_END=2438 /DNA_ORIENTATION=+